MENSRHRFSIRYYRMNPGPGKGLTVRLFGRLVYCAYWRRGFWWFRVFGTGISCTNDRLEEVLFSRRMKILGWRVGRWHFGWLRAKEMKKITHMDLIAINKELGYKPCPCCGGYNFSFACNRWYGHGESGFSDARIKCSDCTCSMGDGYGYGDPRKEDVEKAYNQWNNRKI